MTVESTTITVESTTITVYRLKDKGVILYYIVILWLGNQKTLKILYF